LQHPTTDYDLSHWQQADFTWQIYNANGDTPYDVSGVITASSVFVSPEPSTIVVAGFGAICTVVRGLARKGKAKRRATIEVQA
jgi:hypothetical protein